MKTAYKYIVFNQVGDQRWVCQNRRQHYPLGDVVYNARWKEWEFQPEMDMGFTIECLQDLAHFVGQLNEQQIGI